MPNIEGNVSSANLNGNISTSSNISGNIYPRGEQGKSGTIKVGEVKTVEYNQSAKVTNVGDENNAILNFEIPKGKTSEIENVDWGKITGNIDNQNDLKQMVNNELVPYVKKDENNTVNLEGNINVISNVTNPFPNNFDKSIVFTDKATGNQVELLPLFSEETYKNMLKIAFSDKTQKRIARFSVNIYGDVATSGAFITSNSSQNGAVQIAHSVKNRQAIISAKRGDTNTQVVFGVDSDGIKHGIYSAKLNKWIVEADAEEANFNGKWNGLVNDINTVNTTDDWVPVINHGRLEHRIINIDLNNRGTFNMNNSSRHLDYNNQDRRRHLLTAESMAWWNGAYNENGYSNLEYCLQGQIQAKPKILFDNGNGQKGDITLNDNVNNYERVVIYFKDTETHANSSLIVTRGFNKYIILSILIPYPDLDIKVKVNKYLIKDNALRLDNAKVTNLKDNRNARYDANDIAILKVEGYK